MAKRPGGVTFVAILTWIQGALNVLAGILAVVIGSAVPTTAGTAAVVIGILTIVIGLVVVVIARGLLSGKSSSRVIVTVFMVLSLASAVWATLQGQTGNILTGLVALVIIILLWTGRASTFFRK